MSKKNTFKSFRERLFEEESQRVARVEKNRKNKDPKIEKEKSNILKNMLYQKKHFEEMLRKGWRGC